MIYNNLSVPGLVRIELDRKGDERGFFARIFCKTEFEDRGLIGDWNQVNGSLTGKKGTIRGLHFQYPPQAEVKLVRCVKGAIFDVGVDLREGSPTFGQWAGIELSETNGEMLYIPQGFAHGFQALEDDSEIIYFNSAPYSPEFECGLRFDDPDVGVDWPQQVSVVSERDKNLQTLESVKRISI